MFKLKKIFTSQNIENCSVIIAIGLIVFFTIDMYMFNTIEGATIDFTPGLTSCPNCYERVPKRIREFIGKKTVHGKTRKCFGFGWAKICRKVRSHNTVNMYRNITKYEQQQLDNFHECCQKEHPCREEKKRQCRQQNCLTSSDQASCDNNNCEALDPKACDFT